MENQPPIIFSNEDNLPEEPTEHTIQVGNGYKNRSLIPSSFGLAIFCFLLPFLDLKCGGQKVATFSGVDLMLGAKASQSDMFEGMPTSSGGGSTQLFAILAFLTCALGLLTFLSKSKEEYTIGKGSSIAGTIFLLLLMMTTNQSIQNESRGAVTVSFLIGFWGCFIAVVAAGIMCYQATQAKDNLNPIQPPRS